MRIGSRPIFTIAAVLAATVLYAQGGARVPCDMQELKAAMDRYESLLRDQDTWTMRMEMLSYADERGGVVEDQGQTVLVRSGDRVYAEQLGMVTCQEGRLSATADPEEKVVVLSDAAPVTELMTRQRLNDLAATATRLTRRNTAMGVDFRLEFDPARSHFTYVEVGYDGRGYLAGIVMQWKRSVDPNLPIPAQVPHAPRVELRATPPLVPSAKQIEEARSGMRARLRRAPAGDDYEAIGPWAGYRVVDTRPRR